MYPGGAPIRRATECSSMYSDMSSRISCFSLSKSCSARALHSSVLPTPVGPRKRAVSVGWCLEASPARERSTALETASTALRCPTTREASWSGRSRSLARSSFRSRETGTPTHRDTTSRTSSGPTVSETSFGRSTDKPASDLFLTMAPPPPDPPPEAPPEPLSAAASDASAGAERRRSSSWRPGSTSYLISATRSSAYRRSSSAMLRWASSILFRTSWVRVMRSRSSAKARVNGPSCPSSALRVSSTLRAFSAASARSLSSPWLASLRSARSSISSCSRLRWRRSTSSGCESSCTRTDAHASSIRSIALSGSLRAGM
mmetsp:Transcript_27723/g.65687  ORF Transcript_27723/g.65687 Transcript_27723/m.65687 type:complete len:317 (-) Transcript_27723:988-1938(-)